MAFLSGDFGFIVFKCSLMDEEGSVSTDFD
jgi:hypothetical protein